MGTPGMSHKRDRSAGGRRELALVTRGATTAPEPLKTWPEGDSLTIASSINLESVRRANSATHSPIRSKRNVS